MRDKNIYAVPVEQKNLMMRLAKAIRKHDAGEYSRWSPRYKVTRFSGGSDSQSFWNIYAVVDYRTGESYAVKMFFFKPNTFRWEFKK